MAAEACGAMAVKAPSSASECARAIDDAALDEPDVVEVVAGEHAGGHAGSWARTAISASASSRLILTPATRPLPSLDDPQHGRAASAGVARAEVAGQPRVERRAEPVQDHRASPAAAITSRYTRT